MSQAEPELLIIRPPPPKFWDHRGAVPFLVSAVWDGTQGPMCAAVSQLSPAPVSAWIFLNLRESQQPSVCPGLVCGEQVSGSAITSHSNLGAGTVHIPVGQLKTLRPKEQQ